MDKIKIGILGASGYTGAEAVRLCLAHPHIEIAALSAHTHAGQSLAALFPHFMGADLPPMLAADAIDWNGIDAALCALPHAAAQDVIATLPPHVRVIDMSADFRLRDAATYEAWYGRTHAAPALLAQAVYGLSEHNAKEIAAAQLVACPGCYPTAALLLLLPLLQAGLIDADDLIIDAKSGASGAGRSVKESNLFCEVAEGTQAYSVAAHRHAPEIEQELSRLTKRDVVVSFTPHLMPMNRGELLSVYARTTAQHKAADIRAAWQTAYADAPFMRVADAGIIASTRHVRGSNYCMLAAFDDRISGRVILFSAIDNLIKGSSGQAVQNINLMFGFGQTSGLEQQPLVL